VRSAAQCHRLPLELAGALDEPVAGALDEPVAGALEEAAAGALDAATAGALDEPLVGVLDEPLAAPVFFDELHPATTSAPSTMPHVTLEESLLDLDLVM
jgi:hypothetical protein